VLRETGVKNVDVLCFADQWLNSQKVYSVWLNCIGKHYTWRPRPLVIQHGMRMCHIIVCGLPPLQYFSTLCLKRHDF
jgi:hypothetical protein